MMQVLQPEGVVEAQSRTFCICTGYKKNGNSEQTQILLAMGFVLCIVIR